MRPVSCMVTCTGKLQPALKPGASQRCTALAPTADAARVLLLLLGPAVLCAALPLQVSAL